MSTIAESRDVLPAGTWQVDPVHSHVGFAVDYIAGTFRGTFSPVEATLEVREDGTAALSGSTAAASVNVLDENLRAHLQSPEFFDAERAPEIGFRSNEIVRRGRALTVAGELSIRGTALPVELTGTITDPIADPYNRERLSLTLAGSVDRTRFGIDWNNPLPSGEPALADLVSLTAELYLVKA